MWTHGRKTRERALIDVAFTAPYAASKAAQVIYASTLAKELSGRSISVNSVAPGAAAMARRRIFDHAACPAASAWCNSVAPIAANTWLLTEDHRSLN